MSISLFARLRKHPQNFSKLCGFSLSQFQEMMEKLRPSWDQLVASKKLPGRPTLSLEDELFMLLIYYRAYVTLEWLGLFFRLDKANVSRHFKRFEPLVASNFHIEKDRTLNPQQVETWIIDATEIPVQRPQNQKKRKKTYSGKKKRNTVKFEAIINAKTNKIVDVSKPFPGSIHDFQIRKCSDPLPPSTTVLADLGYLGLNKIHKNTIIPKKRKRGQSLKPEERAHNREVGRKRIKVEHTFVRIKKWKIFQYPYRNHLHKLGLRFNIMCGLYNEFLA